MNNVVLTKKEVRTLILRLRDTISVKDKAMADQSILAAILTSFVYTDASELLCYVSYKSEVDTISLIEKALADGKRVACPRMEQTPGCMNFYEITSLQDLQKNAYGILEPLGSVEMIPAEHTYMLMPGCVFDAAGNRIGYGGGYYDRYLSRYSELKHKAYGLFYEVQRVDAIQVEETDQKMQGYYTEKGFYLV